MSFRETPGRAGGKTGAANAARSGAVCLALLLGASGCSQKKVLLQYRFPPGYFARYTWSIQATTSTESPTELRSDRLDALVEVEERVERGPQDQKTLRVLLRPRAVKTNGKAEPLPPPSSIDYLIGEQGQIRKVLHADLPPGAISSLELDALASESRPPLSSKPVGIDGVWGAPVKVKTERSSIDLLGSGRLTGFDLSDRRRLARVETLRRGVITSTQPGRGAVTLKGPSSSKSVATVDMDRGVLTFSSYRSTSNFDVLLAGGPAAKVKVRLSGKLRLITPDD